MAARILDGRKLASEIREDVKKRVSSLSFKPGLATILVGGNPASKLYVSMKQKACLEVGFYSENFGLPEETTEEEVISLIKKLNENDSIHGVLIQLPLPSHIDAGNVMEAISPSKDVDGFHPLNMGRLLVGDESFAAATPKGIIRLLEGYKIGLKGRDVLVVNHSIVVGKPLALMMLNRNATVSVCHVYTKNLREYTLKADVIVTATGIPHLIKEDMIQEGAVIVDAGIARVEGKTVGDVDFEAVKNKASYITPVPGGVGP